MAEGDHIPLERATDEQVLGALKTAVVEPLAEAWKTACAQTKMFTEANRGRMSKDDLESAVAPMWAPVWAKLDSLEYVSSHIRSRITKARAKGILNGDPREADIFRIPPP